MRGGRRLLLAVLTLAGHPQPHPPPRHVPRTGSPRPRKGLLCDGLKGCLRDRECEARGPRRP